MTGQESAALEASLAEIDNRLFAVINGAICDSWGGVPGPEGDYAIITGRIARAVWAWLAEGDA